METKKLPLKKIIIRDLLKEGEENSTKARVLMQILGVDYSQIKAQVHYERAQGVPILSKFEKGGGYFLPKDQEEFDRYITRRTGQFKKSLVLFNSLKKKNNVFPEQLTIDDVEQTKNGK